MVQEEKKRKGVDNSEPVPKRQCHEDKLVKEILAGDELTDEHITFTTALLKWQFPNHGGLQSTLLAQKNFVSPVVADIDCIQIHHTRQFHWVISSAAVNDTMCMTSNLVWHHFLQVCKSSWLIYKARITGRG